MSGCPSWKTGLFGLLRLVSAFFALFRRVRRATGKSGKAKKKAFCLGEPWICLNPISEAPICWEFPNQVVSSLVGCNPRAEALFGALLLSCVCAHLRSFARRHKEGRKWTEKGKREIQGERERGEKREREREERKERKERQERPERK